jgi:hypothetical protein
MKNIILFIIFSILIALSTQQITFAEIEGEKERAKAAEEVAKKYKREIKESQEKETEEKEEVEIKKEIRSIPSKLKKILPTEEKLEEITFRTIWKYIDKQSNLDEEIGIETMSALLRDITRVYDPIVNKYKVATIQIEIIKYKDQYELESYWDETTINSIEKIFDNAYLVGSPNENIDCMFNYSSKGAVTLCKTDEYIVQSIIFDEYQEHFSYNKLKIGSKKLQLNQDEMTTRIVEVILKKIDQNMDYHLYKILESNIEIKEKEHREKEQREINSQKNRIEREKENKVLEEKNKNKQLGIEKDKKYGVQNFSCIKDEFGLITISGQFNNNQIKKDKVVLNILFLDYEQNIIFKNTANLLEINEFETKRFLGNTKINKSFSTCTIKADY